MPAIASAGGIDLLDQTLRGAIASATTELQTTAILWLSSFVLLQFLIRNISLLIGGSDIDAFFGKFIGSMFWFGFCFYVMKNGTDFIGKVSAGFLVTAAEISGADAFDTANILSQGATLAGNLLGKINSASSITNLFMPSIIGGILGLVIMATAALIGFKIFIIKIESMLIIMMAPLSFSLLGLSALKDQGIAPFKSLLSLLYRIMLIAVILKAMNGMSDNLVAVIKTINSDSISGIWSVLFAAVTGYVLLGYLVFKSDSIASNLASGNTNLGTGDVASAAAMGAAMGAVAGTGGAAAAGAAAKAPQSMSNFMGGLASGGGAVSNASGRGSGQTPSQAPSRAASMSTANSGSVGSSASSASGPSSSASAGGAPVRPVSAGAGDPGAAPSASGGAGSNAASGGKADSAASEPSAGGNAQSAGSVADGGASPSASGGAPVQPGGSGAAGEAPVRPESSSGAGSGANAGAGAPLEQKLDKLTDVLMKQAQQGGAPRKASFGDKLGELNRHVEREKATTGVSINTHHSD